MKKETKDKVGTGAACVAGGAVGTTPAILVGTGIAAAEGTFAASAITTGLAAVGGTMASGIAVIAGAPLAGVALGYGAYRGAKWGIGKYRKKKNK